MFGLDIEEIFTAYRASITETSSTLDFIEILDQTNKACKGSHLQTSSVTSASYASNDFLRSYTAGYLNDQIVRIHEVYFNHLLTRNPEFQIRLNLPLIYYQGDYYVQHDFA